MRSHLNAEIKALFPDRLTVPCAARLIPIRRDCVFSERLGFRREIDLADVDDLYGRSERLGEVTSAGALTLCTSVISCELARSGSLLEWFLSAPGHEVKGYTKIVSSGFSTVVFARIPGDVEVPAGDGFLQYLRNTEVLELIRRTRTAPQVDGPTERTGSNGRACACRP